MILFNKTSLTGGIHEYGDTAITCLPRTYKTGSTVWKELDSIEFIFSNLVGLIFMLCIFVVMSISLLSIDLIAFACVAGASLMFIVPLTLGAISYHRVFKKCVAVATDDCLNTSIQGIVEKDARAWLQYGHFTTGVILSLADDMVTIGFMVSKDTIAIRSVKMETTQKLYEGMPVDVQYFYEGYKCGKRYVHLLDTRFFFLSEVLEHPVIIDAEREELLKRDDAVRLREITVNTSSEKRIAVEASFYAEPEHSATLNFTLKFKDGIFSDFTYEESIHVQNHLSTNTTDLDVITNLQGIDSLGDKSLPIDVDFRGMTYKQALEALRTYFIDYKITETKSLLG